MYWIVNDYTNNKHNIVNNDDEVKYVFYQIFNANKFSTRNEALYNIICYERFDQIIKLRKSDIINVICDIKIKDSVIQYNYKIGTIEYCRTFLFNDEFTSEDNPKNCLRLPNIKYNYLKTDNYKMPNILSKDYDYIYNNIEFEILPYSKKTLLIKQKGEEIKNFIITNDFQETKKLVF